MGTCTVLSGKPLLYVVQIEALYEDSSHSSLTAKKGIPLKAQG